MSVTKPVVFLSSTSDLIAEREALLEALSRYYQPYLYEQEGANRQSPQKWCRKRIREAHVFIGVLGERYGSYVSDDEDLSIVEWEFETARQEPDLAIMMFVKEDIAPETLDPEQRQFIDRISAFTDGVWRLEYDSCEQLVRRVKASIQQLLAEFYARSIERFRRMRNLGRIFQPVSGGLVLVVLALAVQQGRGQPVIGAMWLGALGAICIGIIILCIVLNRS